MIRLIAITCIAVAAVAITGINAYLSPDDLRKCGETPSNSAGCEKFDAIVAVSGGNTLTRTTEAVRLYKNGWADYIIFSGAAFDKNSPSNAAVMREEARQRGVPETAIITEETSRTTHQNAQNTAEILNKYDIKTLLVVTSPYHQRRAGLEFQTITGSSVKIANHPASNDSDWPWYWWITPRGWWLAVGEMAKIGATHAGESLGHGTACGSTQGLRAPSRA